MKKDVLLMLWFVFFKMYVDVVCFDLVLIVYSALLPVFLRERYGRDYLSDYVCMFYVGVMCMFCDVFNL